ncbi:hypothetical protein [Arthrobacter sp. ES1]|uniref:hypothetical protein n=1 Tax=Arthrobacter sp. ES1 TaxID=1897056 RepID=UPI001D00023C|nr:hypothetical protein [Arthrobacter sp. ES1]MCB5280562.1 hypothetical protein [Arthrobacter sp. ES1]
MTAPAIKSVTKTVLSGFVREHTTLNLTQAKLLTDQLLAEYIVTVKPPADSSSIPVEPGQLWIHTGSKRTLRVTEVELGPIYVPGDPVTSWGPQSVSWQNPDDPAAVGNTMICLWREQMRLVPNADQPSTTTATPTSESETAS